MSTHDKNGLRFRVLVPVWGERYIRDFCAISLPALLADGNLPELARAGQCEIIFLTTQSSQAIFESSEGIQRIKKVCGYSFIAIDDLLPLESYGIILTVAYGRGIASLGSLQTSTYFVFLNADFVLSNGILRTVVERARRGFRAVMAPSLRSRQEEVVDDLERRVSLETGTLDASPAELVHITLRSLHITARASLVNQQMLHHIAANQFFWRVDDDTLIGHFFLLFMLCIRPETEFQHSKGWCDYVFVPELVPSGNYDVIVDSDEGFILEMQARRGDSEHVLVRRIAAKDFASRLSLWTTAHHRDYATRPIVFHAAALPTNFASVKSEAESFMAELFGHLKQPPTSHLDHPYWTGTVPKYQRNLPPDMMPPELPLIEQPRLQSIRRSLTEGNLLSHPVWAYLDKTLMGRPPKLRPLHYAYLDYENFAKEIATFRGKSRNPLQIRERPSTIDLYLADGGPLTTIDIGELDAFQSASEPFDGVVIALKTPSRPGFARLLRLATAHCPDGAPVLICIDAVYDAFFSGWFSVYTDTIELMEAMIDSSIIIDGHRMIGENERLAPVYRLSKMRELLLSRSTSAWIASLVIALPAFARILYTNVRPKGEGSAHPGFCTSVTIRLRAPWQSMRQERIQRACRFDPAFYLHINMDVARAGVNPEVHFFEQGWKERRDPSAYFSVSGYLDANPDVAEAEINPLTHFVEFGLLEGRRGWQK